MEEVLEVLDEEGPRETSLEAAANRARMRDNWIGDEFSGIWKELQALKAIKRQKGQPKVYLQMPSEVLKAFELGVVTKAEARAIMGLKKARQPAQLARARSVSKAASTRPR